MSILNQPVRPSDPASGGNAALSSPIVRSFIAALSTLLLGYMFLGRGFAHLGFPPLYVGEIVLAVGIVATGFALWRLGVHTAPTRTVWLLLGFMLLGALRTVPYLGEYGLDALRDATLWGYAVFALMVFLLADRSTVLRAFRLYGWVVPVFALWLPICYNIFAAASREIDPTRPGSLIPLVFFKGGDMAVHIVGAIAFLVLGTSAITTRRSLILPAIVAVPMLWMAFVLGAANRGGLLTVVAGLVVLVALAPRWRNWRPILLAAVLITGGLAVEGVLIRAGGTVQAPTASPTAAVTASPRPTPTPTLRPGSTPSPSPAVTPGGSARSSAAVPTSTPSGRPNAAPSPAPPLPEFGERVPIDNPGFELGVVGSGIEGWLPSGLGTYTIVGDGGYRGRYVEIDNTGAAYQATLMSSRFAFTAGEDIQVSLWAKAVRGRPTVEIYVNWFDRTGRQISSDFVGGYTTSGARAWQEVIGVFESPPGTATGEILLWEAAGHATIGIDEVSVRAGDFIVEQPPPVPPEGRPATISQILENIFSLFGTSEDRNLEGTKQFRLAWWGKIVGYTAFGDYFWSGKGFGINLADADGFQSTADHSLRAPHNSHLTVLARMGVPGFVLWIVIQVGIGMGLLRAILANRRAGDSAVAAAAAWLLAYWIAMMVDTSFDPYLEGPQGGIWFWTVVGLALVVMNLPPQRHEA